MGFRFAKEIIDEIRTNGTFSVSKGYVTGREFEEWLYEDIVEPRKAEFSNVVISSDTGEDCFSENYGEAA